MMRARRRGEVTVRRPDDTDTPHKTSNQRSEHKNTYTHAYIKFSIGAEFANKSDREPIERSLLLHNPWTIWNLWHDCSFIWSTYILMDSDCLIIWEIKSEPGQNPGNLLRDSICRVYYSSDRGRLLTISFFCNHIDRPLLHKSRTDIILWCEQLVSLCAIVSALARFLWLWTINAIMCVTPNATGMISNSFAAPSCYGV